MDLFASCWVVDGDFVGGDADVGTVFLVEAVDVVDAAALDDGEFEGEVCEFGKERAGDFVEGRFEGDEEGLSSEDVRNLLLVLV